MSALLLESRLLGAGGCKPHGSLASLAAYIEEEKHNARKCSVRRDGTGLLEYETLELRVHPPNIEINNSSDEAATDITVDSANRPGTLVEVVQWFTELGLEIRRARISSDGGWFINVFSVTEGNGEKVRSQRKLNSIKQMLSVHVTEEGDIVNSRDDISEGQPIATTVLDLAGQDKAGLLADVTELLTQNGCDVRSAAVWTYNGRVAFVLSVTEKGQPVVDSIKLQRLRQILFQMMDSDGGGIVSMATVRSAVHHERRLHQLMLAEEVKAWDRSDRSGEASTSRRPAPALGAPGVPCEAAALGEPRSVATAVDADRNGPAGGAQCSPADSVSSLHEELAAAHIDAGDSHAQYRSPKHSRPQVDILPCSHTGYWLVTVSCKDRNKLLFDTVCTLADMDYDVYHATIDSHHGIARQEYYIKPRYGGSDWSDARAAKLVAMMGASIQRRFPKGLKVHVHSVDRFGCLAAITRVLKAAGLSITRAKVKTYAVNESSGHTFYLMSAAGGAPDRAAVEAACRQIGGQLVEAGDECERAAALGLHKFSFSFLNRRWHQGWGGSPCSSVGSA